MAMKLVPKCWLAYPSTQVFSLAIYKKVTSVGFLNRQQFGVHTTDKGYIKMKTIKKTFWVGIALLAMLICTSHAFAQKTESLKGTWMIDTKATEESLVRTRPFKDAAPFISEISFYGNLTFEFNGNKLLLGVVPDTFEKHEYDLVSGQSAEMKYVKKINTAANQTVIGVSVLNDKNLSIAFLGHDGMKYLLWKRVKLDPNKKTPNDFKPEFDAFLAMIMNIDKAFASTLWPEVKK